MVATIQCFLQGLMLLPKPHSTLDLCVGRVGALLLGTHTLVGKGDLQGGLDVYEHDC